VLPRWFLLSALEVLGQTDRRRFSSAKVDAETGPSAAPNTSRAHMRATTRPLEPQVNVCCDFCHLFAFISHVWSPSHGCRSKQTMQCLQRRFHQPKTFHAHAEVLWDLWFHSRTLDRSVWLAFTLLLVVLATQHSRGESHAPEKLYTRHLSFPTHFSGHGDLALPGWSIPIDSEYSMRFRDFPRESRPSKSRVRPN
jgi:hypothetical protein